MKIGMVLESNLNIPGGVQEYVRGLYDYLESEGHLVEILTAGSGWDHNSDRNITQLGKSVEIPIPGISASTPLIRVKARNISQHLSQKEYDILHFQGPGGYFNSRILKQSKAINIITFHVYHTGIIPGLAAILWPWERHLNHKYARKIAVSPLAASFAARICPGSFDLIPNGVNLERFCPDFVEIEKRKDSLINILFVGRLDRRKGLSYLLSAYKNMDPSLGKRLMIVGDGPEKKPAERYVRQHRLQNVFFFGRVKSSRLPEIYRSADIFCAPATHGESFGIVLLEAMAAGLPIVAFANPGYKEVLRHSPFYDFIVIPKDVAELSRQIQILASDKNLRQRLSQAGQEHVQQYSWDQVGKQIMNLYQKALASA
jgi:phosphatidylinositol alpha-mannosyltransferase